MARTTTRRATRAGPKSESKISGQSSDRKSITERPEDRPNISILPKQDEEEDDRTGADEPFQSHTDTQGAGGGRDMRHRSEGRHHSEGQHRVTASPEVSEVHAHTHPRGAAEADAMDEGRPYLMLMAMAVLSFIVMYGLMYAMVDRSDNVFNSINQVYMAGLMAAPMVVIELLLMGRMYPNRNANIMLGIVSIVVMLLFWFAIRGQWAVGNEQFLRSMIPHHAGAVLMCRQAPVTDQRIQQLCQEIIAGQEKEIAEMKTLLAGSPPQ